MSYSDQPSGSGGGGGGPYRDMRDQGQGESQYPPLPDEDDRARAYHHRPSSSVTLPSISPYDPQYVAPQPNGYSQAPNGYGQPQPHYNQPQQGGYGRDPRGSYPAEYGRSGPQQHMSFTQSAPRQRTAIACRYCRRRKIRCSGFEQNAQGRCSNCQRFQQDCIFTPVSSQAQAFVPAHAAYPHLRNMAVGPDGQAHPVYPHEPQQLYGAHGQPLGQVLPPASTPYDYAMPSPTGSYSSFVDERGESSRKRHQDEPHPSILPPPVPGQASYPRQNGARRRAAEDDLRLPPVTPTAGPQPTSNYSPGSSTSSHSGLRPPQEQGYPALSRTPPPRSSPGDRSDPMSLGNIMEQHPGANIDKNMLNRLDRKPQ